jgi:hypothetical protein
LIGPQIGADLKLFEWGSCGAAYGSDCGGAYGTGAGAACGSGAGLFGGGVGAMGSGAGSLRGLFSRGGGCRFRINSTINIGVLYNHVIEDPWSSIIGPPLTSESNEVALLGEVGLTAKFRLTNHVAIRGGYQVMALHGVALAPDQIASADVVTETSSVTLSSLITHGGTFGIEVFW